MAAYKDLVGQKITKVTSNPGEPKTGQMWYNSTDGKLRGLGIVEAWASAAPMNTGVYGAGGGGPQTASIVAGGNTQTGTTATTEFYNGSGWSSSTNINTSRGALGSSKDGSQTAHLVFGGTSNSTASESWNGSSWTATPALNTGKNYTSGAGTSTAAVNAGRWGPPLIGNTEEYNGSSWSEQNDLSTARGDMGSFGTQTAAIFAGGNKGSPPNYANDVEQYDGSSWTTLPNLNTARANNGSGAGSSTSGLFFGGNTPGPSASNASESWDGTSWTNTPSLAEAGTRSGNGASGSSALAYGDYPVTGVTEEFTKSTNTITAAAFSSGGALPTPIAAHQGAGIQTAALSISGQPNSPGTAATAATNHYNGSSWTAGGSLSAGAASYGGVSATKGTETASLYWDGYNPTPSPAGYRATVSSYNGSSWTAQSTFPGSPAGYCGGAGTSTAALSIGGSLVTNCYESDGSYNWTAAGALPAAKYAMAAGGPQTAAIGAGGYGGSPVVLQNTADTYNGTSWTSIGTTPITQASKNGCFGTDSSDFMVAGGTPARSTCLHYDGTAWSTRPSISTGRHAVAGAGASGTSGLIAGGNTGSFTTATEEFTGETTAVNITDFTTS